MDDPCCTCSGKSFMAAPDDSIYAGMWVCASCGKPRRLYFERAYEQAKLQSGNDSTE